jgi:hypothetical protein
MSKIIVNLTYINLAPNNDSIFKCLKKYGEGLEAGDCHASSKISLGGVCAVQVVALCLGSAFILCFLRTRASPELIPELHWK